MGEAARTKVPQFCSSSFLSRRSWSGVAFKRPARRTPAAVGLELRAPPDDADRSGVSGSPCRGDRRPRAERLSAISDFRSFVEALGSSSQPAVHAFACSQLRQVATPGVPGVPGEFARPPCVTLGPLGGDRRNKGRDPPWAGTPSDWQSSTDGRVVHSISNASRLIRGTIPEKCDTLRDYRVDEPKAGFVRSPRDRGPGESPDARPGAWLASAVPPVAPTSTLEVAVGSSSTP